METEAEVIRELDLKSILGGTRVITTIPFCYIMANMPTTMTPQDGNECVAATLGYRANIFGNSFEDEGYFVNSWESQNPGQNVEQDGMSSTFAQMNNFVGQNFQTSTLTQAGGLIAALDQGDVIFAQITMPGSTDLHAVTIIGHNTDSNPLIKYMDPATGATDTMSVSDLNTRAQNAVVVNGTCAP